MRFYITIIVVLLLSISCITAQAEKAPIIDLNDLPENNTSAAPAPTDDALTTPTTTPASAPDPMATRQSLPTDQRLRLLEQQVGNFMQMNFPAKMDNLEQQIHQLNGQIEEQTHLIEQLQSQLQKQPAQEPVKVSTPPAAKVEQKTPTSSIAPESQPVDATAATTDETAASPIKTAETAVVQNRITTAAADSAKATESAERAYQIAFDLMVKKQNTTAITAFKNFLKNYPDNTAYAPSAHYWLGELYTMANKNALAGKEFSALIQKYPSHAKIPDAMLKLAIIHDDAGQRAQAKHELQKVVAEYPDSTAAKLAKMRLKGMKSTT